MTDSAEREAAILRDLSRPENLPHARGEVEVERTHGSLVFLTETEVFKLKRAVDFGFFDFTTREARRLDSEAEIRLNRRTAPDVYLGVLPVHRDEHGFSLTRGGEVDDWAVHMQRLPADCCARDMLAAGCLTAGHLDRLARFVADFYRRAERHEPAFEDLRSNIDENSEQTAPFAGRFVEAELVDDLRAHREAWLARHEGLLRTRPARDGHGDLRLEHAYFVDGDPVLIDCIEFNDRFRIADPALDVAFLAMDLERSGRDDLAELFLGAFAYESDDYGFWPLIDGYESYRAFVRAKVACFVAADPSTTNERVERKTAEAAELFALSRRLVRPRRTPRLIAVGGLPATGKSTIARTLRRLLPSPIVSADSTRKWLAGVDKLDPADASAYAPEFSARVFDEMLQRTEHVLASGRPVVVDTTFHRHGLLDRFRTLARRHGAPFTFVECEAPEQVLRARIRSRGADVSDADENVLDGFLREAEPPDELPAHEHVHLDTTRSQGEIEDRLRQALENR